MKTNDPRRNEKKAPPDTDNIERKFPPEDPATEEFVSGEADWSNDKSDYKKGKSGDRAEK